MAWSIVVAAVLYSILCGRRPSPPPRDTVRPTIYCRSISYHQYTGKGLRYARVVYPMATARDNRGIASVRQTSPTNYRSGSNFPIGTYVIQFTAVDTSRLCSYCYIRFRVIARTCSYPATPSQGTVSCTTPRGQTPIYGDRCTFGCRAGYQLVGARVQECSSSKRWSGGGRVTCKPIVCPAPATPANAVRVSCTKGYSYDSVCVFKCRTGFSLAPRSGRSFKCGVHRRWIGYPVRCVDSTSPVIQNCPASQTLYAGRNGNFTIARWTVPRATDNVDRFVTVRQKSGPQPGSRFYAGGVYKIAYGAADSSRNMAEECEFFVVVRQITCPPLSVPYRMNMACSSKLIYGATCRISCHHGYPMVGSNQAICEKTAGNQPAGVWRFGQSRKATYCEVKKCPELDVPKNGTLRCDKKMPPTCRMACGSGYDIPRTAPETGRYDCRDTDGAWLPHAIVPDCTRKRGAKTVRLPVKLNYYSGDCSSKQVQEKIKQKFIEQLTKSQFSTVCTQYPDCKAENVKVSCERISGSRPSGLPAHLTHQVTISFDFVLNGVYKDGLTAQQMTQQTNQEFQKLRNKFTSDLNNGIFDIPDLTVQKQSVTFGDCVIECEKGTVVAKSTFTCRACPTGMYYNSLSDNCTYCAVGKYQNEDGETSCKDCPKGYSTAETGARSKNMCKKVCDAGSYSTTGVVPCSPCPVNTYAHDTTQRKCKPCPTGLHTIDTGSDSILNCTSKGPTVGPCASHPCSPHGVCTSKTSCSVYGLCIRAYQCHCKPGYSGKNCQITPDPCEHHICQNNAKCVRDGLTVNTYTCKCTGGFAGTLCQYERVDGGWSKWGEWSQCSVTCGTGQQTRARRCDSPTPNQYGSQCAGENTQTQRCLKEECRVCKKPKLPYGVRRGSQTVDSRGHSTYRFHCIPGYRRFRSYPSSIECGPDTNFTWSPPVPHAYLACTNVRFPRQLASEYTIKYSAPPPPSPSKEETDTYINMLLEIVSKAAPCVANKKCNVEPKVTSARTQLTVVVKVHVQVPVYDFMKGGVYDRNVENEGSKVLNSYDTQLEAVAAALNRARRNDKLVFKIRGTDYHPDYYSMRLVGKAACADGERSISVFCYMCPPGFYEEMGRCNLCGLGQYQSKPGQKKCNKCSDGRTTSEKGSTDLCSCVRPRAIQGPIQVISATTAPIKPATARFGIYSK